MNKIEWLEREVSLLKKFVEFIRDFFTDDSIGHARYLKGQAERVLRELEEMEKH